MENTIEQQLIEKSPKNFRQVVLKAIEFGKKYHEGQNRLSGEQYINHPIRCALTLAEMGFETNTIIGAIFHNVISKNESRREEIENGILSQFGQDVLFLVHSCENISKATGSKDTDYQVINKYILNSSTDLRPVLIKLADTLDNVRTIEYMPEERIGSKIQKVFNVYGPLAEYLNLNQIKKELEERALEIYRKDDHEDIKNMMSEENYTEEFRDKYIAYIENLLKQIPGEQIVHGRVKSIYSIYAKQKKYLNEGHPMSLSNIQDILGFRIITDTEEECFKVLELIMDNGEILEEYFDDYISNPKPNGYRALQTPVILPAVSRNIVEIQIMTKDMYYENTYGKASHIAYKESKSRYAKPTDKYNWVEEIHKEIDKNISLREQKLSMPIKVDIFKENVYAFTPKGMIIQLDKGDTVIDFAFLVHSDIGVSMVSAKVNGQPVKHDYEIQTGDVVEIKTQPGKKTVNPEWIRYTKSPSIRRRIQKTWKSK